MMMKLFIARRDLRGGESPVLSLSLPPHVVPGLWLPPGPCYILGQHRPSMPGFLPPSPCD